MPLSSKPSNFKAIMEAKLAAPPEPPPIPQEEEEQIPEQENQEGYHLQEAQPPAEQQTETQDMTPHVVSPEESAAEQEAEQVSKVNWQKRYSDLRSDTQRQINDALAKQREEFSKVVEHAASYSRPPAEPAAPEPELDPEYAAPMKRVAEEALRQIIDPVELQQLKIESNFHAFERANPDWKNYEKMMMIEYQNEPNLPKDTATLTRVLKKCKEHINALVDMAKTQQGNGRPVPPKQAAPVGVPAKPAMRQIEGGTGTTPPQPKAKGWNDRLTQVVSAAYDKAAAGKK